MKRAEGFTADDGTWFTTAAECKQYEEGGRLLDLLSHLSHAKIQTALDRTDVELADTFERAGNIIARKRRVSGELKRRRAGEAMEASIKDVEKAMTKAAK